MGHLQRRELGSPQDQDHAEAGEVEGEGEYGSRRHCGEQQRQGHVVEGAEAAGAPRALLQMRVQVAPEGRDDAQDDGVVVEGVAMKMMTRELVTLRGGPSRSKRSMRNVLTRPCGPMRAMKPIATTRVGMTNGRVATAFSSVLPGNSYRANRKAAGSPMASASRVETSACQKVNRFVPGSRCRPAASPNEPESRPVSPARLRPKIEARG